tara:strand:- start:501 stop:1685 length:1185 start_codon:yes stop_codon:yes gene_type:complete
LIFQTLDSKNECVGYYTDGKLHFDEEPSSLSKTWAYAPYLDDSVAYASLYTKGKKLGESCPEHLKEDYIRSSQKLKSYFRSFQMAKIDLNSICFFDLVPQRFLLEYYDIRNKITNHVFENYDEPSNYDFLVELTKISYDIKFRKLNVDYSKFSSFSNSEKTKAFHKKLRKTVPYIDYNIFGTVTGRLTVSRDSFPILTFPKSYRKVLKPNNDRFVEFDFNAAELRTLLSLSGNKQPKEDIHEWIVKNVFNNSITREESKTKTFAWLYNPEAENTRLERLFNKNKLVDKYWKDGQVTTPFGRIMKCDRKHALNYLIQSTTSDMFLCQMIEVNKLLKNKKSYISFCMHDSLVIDFGVEDRDLISDLHNLFSQTKLGLYKTNISLGRDYGTMRKMDL